VEYAALRLEKNTLSVISKSNNKPIKGLSRPYSAIAGCVLRSRPYHLDIRFKGKDAKDRIRLMSSFNRYICNDLYLRVPEDSRASFQVEFELGINKFDCQVPYRIRPPKEGVRAAELLSNEKNRADMNQADSHLDVAAHVMKDVKVMAIAMGQEIADSTNDLERLEEETDQTNIKMRKVNKRIDYEIKHN